MNVKFSTLLAGGLLALSTSAFAEVANIKNQLSPVQGGNLVSGNTYFIVTDDNGEIDDTKTVFLGLKNATTEGNVEAVNLKASNANSGALQITNKQIKWVVTVSNVGSEKIYTFTNAETETKLTFGTTGAIKEKKSEAVESETSSSLLTGEAGGVFTSKLTQDPETNNELTIAESGTTLSDDGGKIYFFQVKEKTDINADGLNGLMGNGFMFSFPDADPAPASNPFGSKLTAVNLGGETWNTGENTVKAGLYFVSSLASDALGDNGKFVSKTKFDASTFVAVSTLDNYEINGLNPGEKGDGFKFITVKGEDLVGTKEKGKTMFDNAIFSVSEPDPENGKNIFTMTVKPYVAYGKNVDETNATNDNTVNVVAFTTMGASYVTTLKEVAGKATNKLAVNATNVLAAEDLLKSDAPAVFNIQFTSSEADLKEDKSSEYGKYLGIYNNGGYALLAQGSSFLDLDAPQNQWYVSDVKNGVFTFKNRESGTAINVQLRKTKKENIYDVVSAEGTKVNYAYINGNGVYTIETEENAKALSSGELQIKLIEATITKNAGYLDLSKEELAQPIQIKFTVANKLLSKNMYVEANTTAGTVSLTEDEDYATLWDIVKFAAKEDSISGKIKYAYMKDEKTMDYKEVVDKAITTYALKINGLSKAWYLNFPNQTNGAYNVKQTDKIAQAQRYILKENKNGSIYLIAANVATSNAYDKNIKNNTNALTVGGNATLAEVGIYGAANDDVQMELESVELLSTSLEAEPRHASFKSVNGGFLGMDEDNNAIVAATQEEAKTLTFWLDTTDVKELTTNFYISQAMPEGLKAAEPRMFLFNPVDSTSYYDEGTASNTKDYSYMLSDKATTKAIFKAATLINKDSINTFIKGEEVGLNKDNGLNRFKFQIKEVDDEEYVIASGDKYLSSINGKVGFGDLKNALVVTLGEGDATANEAIEAAGVQVIGSKGAVTVQGAAGKVITVANVLGQTIANQVAASDNVTIAVPAGIVVVAVEGEATKVVVK
ncbi:hypothetical protein JQM84_09865 [Parabacteroides distasonis]|nr:hypothetical protein [Parabacteroides distasonis]